MARPDIICASADAADSHNILPRRVKFAGWLIVCVVVVAFPLALLVVVTFAKSTRRHRHDYTGHNYIGHNYIRQEH